MFITCFKNLRYLKTKKKKLLDNRDNRYIDNDLAIRFDYDSFRSNIKV